MGCVDASESVFLSQQQDYLCNVFAFNWRTVGSVDGRFTGHAANAKAAAADLAAFIRQLIEHGRARQEDIHLVGFGRGAHLAGFAGKKLLEGMPSILIGRITGLDPTGSGFENAREAERLNSTDAKLVVVIHTNAYDANEKDRLYKEKIKSVKTFGIAKQIGHVDFYPNGGMLQPGCRPSTYASHRKATEFFFVSLDRRPRLVGLPCSRYDFFLVGGCGICSGRCFLMGYDFKVPFQDPHSPIQPFEMHGRYYLTTPEEPFFDVEPRFIQLNATSDWGRQSWRFHAEIRTTDTRGLVKIFPVPKYWLCEINRQLYLTLMLDVAIRKFELKIFDTDAPEVSLVRINVTDMLTAYSRIYQVKVPDIGQYATLEEIRDWI